jgi:hypothetical protein
MLPLTLRCGSAGQNGASQRDGRQQGWTKGLGELQVAGFHLKTPRTLTDKLLACSTCRLPGHTTTTQWHRRRPPHQRSTTVRMACHCTTLRTAATTAHPLPLLLPATRLRQRPSVVTGAMSVPICAPITSLPLSYTDAPPFRSPKASAKATTATSSTHTGSRS